MPPARAVPPRRNALGAMLGEPYPDGQFYNQVVQALQNDVHRALCLSKMRVVGERWHACCWNL